MTTYRLYTNDSGADLYSCLARFNARTDESAIRRGITLAKRSAAKILVIPESIMVQSFEDRRDGLKPKPGVFQKYGREISK